MSALGHDSTAHYMANEGLMVEHGDTKILFDPLFRNSYGQYLLLPEEMEQALFAGVAPYDGVDAIFVSHHHGDHFSPGDMVRLLREQPNIKLYAPNQAVIAMRSESSNSDADLFDRVIGVSLEYKDAPVALSMEGLQIEAVRIPHSGWPTGRLDVENIVWRVTLNEDTTVLHMGDADPNDVHFARDAQYWNRNNPHMAFPPYWFFSSASGRDILSNRIKAKRSVGVHVPVTISSDPIRRPAELRGFDLFTIPGETRKISAED
ncbi:MBL fold metallo-hydrolase [Gammaproteobacteria bacterium]|jgi:L-ascorbate metabolism protein UlaG (beta-lactamase superfamily)|nr:MBL fold metallo-hydrolase [Gammaproteobacteria bacterium]